MKYDEEKKDARKGKEQEKPTSGTPTNQQPDAAKQKGSDKKKEEGEEEPKSDFNDWGNPMGEDSDTSNQGRGI